MPVFGAADFDHHENVVFGCDEATGLKCIIAIHNTKRGPALGGSRFWNYENEQDAITDVLRLSKGMTYKAAVAGLDLGGGKSVIIGDAKKIKTPDLMRAFGRVIESLNGKYITAEDVGTTVEDMDHIREVTRHVRGKSTGSGNPSPLTALGTFLGIKAAVKHHLKTDELTGLRISVQGVGNVGYYLCQYLHEAGAKLIVSDINEKALKRVEEEFSAQRVSLEEIYSQEVDVYAPCALGATVNDQTIDQFNTSIIAGSANNQLAEDRHGQALLDKGILYAPDYVINAGGLINVAHETDDYDLGVVKDKIDNIYTTLLEIFQRSQKRNLPTSLIADHMAEELFKEPTTAEAAQ
ncbi:Leucine dehydrogenase [Candidatus Terasakiella magnetica]|uniref:Leucine dehydrogenase n=1 Tax=Candidatus Terasakiella magnetica TaxID=1867952 RepID=A0A1C3RD87_9PROT|nr:Glu/Leu/Phe/Val dehydrogenase [Candidatus Terasakiella magnetica]SCA55229.1 Leucine dehydrogenase [Candidatus Terasakiella magnetica]